MPLGCEMKIHAAEVGREDTVVWRSRRRLDYCTIGMVIMQTAPNLSEECLLGTKIHFGTVLVMCYPGGLEQLKGFLR